MTKSVLLKRVGRLSLLSGAGLALLSLAFVGCEAFRNIEGDWGGYWWYSGTRGNVYITWSFDDEGRFRGAIPSAGAHFDGTYVVNDEDDPATIDVTVKASNSSTWKAGNTYYGYYRIEDGRLYRSQLLPKRPRWSDSLLDQQQGTVFVAERID